MEERKERKEWKERKERKEWKERKERKSFCSLPPFFSSFISAFLSLSLCTSNSPVVRQQAVVVIRFWPADVDLFERRAMIRLLEERIGAYAVRGLQAAHIGDGEGLILVVVGLNTV